MQTNKSASSCSAAGFRWTPRNVFATHVKPALNRAREHVKHLEDRRMADLKAIGLTVTDLADHERKAFDAVMDDLRATESRELRAIEQNLRRCETDAKTALRKIIDS